MYHKKYQKYKIKYLKKKGQNGGTYYYSKIYSFLKASFSSINDNYIKEFAQKVASIAKKNDYIDGLFLDLFSIKQLDINWLIREIIENKDQLFLFFLDNIVNTNFKDSNGNNILNLFISETINSIKNNCENIDENNYISILNILVSKGINIFEFNDDHVSPLILSLLNVKYVNIFRSIINNQNIMNLDDNDFNKITFLVSNNNINILNNKTLKYIESNNGAYVSLYQIANLYYNYQIVDQLFNSNMANQQFYYKILEKINLKKQVFGPLWIQNIYQLRTSIITLLKQSHNDIIKLQSIIPIGKIDRFDIIEYNGKKWLVKPGIDRYFGAKHLKQYGAPVITKKLLKIGNDLNLDIKIEIDINKYPIQQIINISINNFYTLSELIEEKFKPDLSQCIKWWDYGFYDNYQDNCSSYEYIDKESNNKIKKTIIIDTDTDKNFYDNCDSISRFDNTAETKECKNNKINFGRFLGYIYNVNNKKHKVHMIISIDELDLN